MTKHEKYISICNALGLTASRFGEVPVACLIVRNNNIISLAYNLVEQKKNPLFHAELLAVERACRRLNSKFLENCSCYVNLEPCSMCAGGLVLARVENIYFGAYDIKTGGCGSVFSIPSEPALNHNCKVYGGILQNECSGLFRNFFLNLRK